MRIIAVVVLYKCKPEDSKTINSLLSNHSKSNETFRDFKLVIYDNGPVNQSDNLSIPLKYEYIHNSENDGLAAAYNITLKKAVQDGYDWLLLLDQDSTLPDDFIDNLFKELKKIDLNSKVTAIVPKMFYKNQYFSPSKVLYGGIHRPVDANLYGVCKEEICAIGSCSLINVPFLDKIGGFNEVFWMDGLDRWLYMTIWRNGGSVYITNSVIEHELSILDYNHFVNEKRYKDIMKYETLFMKLYKSRTENIVYFLRLVRRTLAFGLSTENKVYAGLTWEHIKNTIFSRDKK